ncbi:hypothetical protein [Streptomyces mangrovisoli]|uniref:Uncharacterized protein n=1 Tax=Streptomyces mangrovisoli TaxID=1428628 RepID=A0A1J4P5H3_9ACTN|nr:hypothetical protein [Streptomyces mangrovisoli]OIJ69832.1 hypothetical protein WN71_000130 [Streptomyces mangrovisoli]
MGIESDQVVYEYLSRVGDVAHQRQLPSATRMRLVSELRNEIDRRRAKAPVDSPAAVRRIIDHLGSPDEVVAAAGGTAPAGVPQPPAPAVPAQRDAGADDDAGSGRRPRGLRRIVPGPRDRDDPPPAAGAAPPHLAGPDEIGTSAVRPDWWRGERDLLAGGDSVPGFVGGVEIPDLLKPPPKEPAEPTEPKAQPGADGGAKAAGTPGAADPPAAVPAARRRWVPVLRPGRWSNPLLLLAAALLVGGAALGNWFALLLGWLIAYGSRRLSPNESKWAVIGMPAVALAAGVGWLWGRQTGRWGSPIVAGHMSDAISQTWPWVVRGAALASAAFLLWRSQRHR